MVLLQHVSWDVLSSLGTYLYDSVGAGSHTSIKSAIRAITTFASTKSSSCRADHKAIRQVSLSHIS